MIYAFSLKAFIQDSLPGVPAVPSYDEISIWIQALGFIGIILSIAVMRRVAIADHSRRRKQSTLEYLHDLRPQWRDSYRVLFNRFKEPQLSSAHAREIMDDDELRQHANEILSLVEHLSVGINTDVYDRDIVEQACGSYLINLRMMMGSFIRLAQERYKNPRLFRELDSVIRGFEDQRRKDEDVEPNKVAQV